MATTPTELVTEWALSSPVLVKWLSEMVRDENVTGVEELPPAVADLLAPQRAYHALAFLRAVGAPESAADALWRALGADYGWMDRVDWDALRSTLLIAHAFDCATLCAEPHPMY